MIKFSLLLMFILNTFHSFSQETFELDWKKMKDWKEASHQEDSKNYLYEYLKKGEKFENWTELISVQRMDATGVGSISLEVLMNSGFQEFKKNAPDATLTFIQKNETATNPWIEYKSEAPRFKNDPNPESQFFHVVKCNNCVFLIWWAATKPQITEEEYKSFQEFFQSGIVK